MTTGNQLTTEEQQRLDAIGFIRIEGSVPRALVDVLRERKRQIEAEGFDTYHDDEHFGGDLAAAAGCYAIFSGEEYPPGHPPEYWPSQWALHWWKPKDRRRDLVRAAALLIAEIERLDRSQGAAS